uniref:Uncharacterized protein n=1 Tax=Anguilla anguilla TaxID=7936 RepID=A0A0E9VZK9_ANGAN
MPSFSVLSWQPTDSETRFIPFNASCSLNGEICPEGQIHSLVLEVFKVSISRTVSPLLPSCVCLRSLHLHSECKYEKKYPRF